MSDLSQLKFHQYEAFRLIRELIALDKNLPEANSTDRLDFVRAAKDSLLAYFEIINENLKQNRFTK